jgi:MerR family transcriptional regulator, copper efflux regulator
VVAAFRISDAALATGIPATTLRYWERVGLLSAARTGSGYRLYGERDLERLRFIRTAKHLALPLDDIAELVRAWDGGTCATVKARLEPMISERLQQVGTGLDELAVLADTLRAGLASVAALPDREDPCGPACAVLTDGRRPDPDTSPHPGPQPEAVLACTLSGADHAERLARWSELVGVASVTRDGLLAKLTFAADRAGEAAALVVAEQACCSFLGFSLTFAGSSVILTVRAPNADALPFVDALLGLAEGGEHAGRRP